MDFDQFTVQVAADEAGIAADPERGAVVARATHARQATLSPVGFLELLLQDEIDRRDSQGLARRIEAAGFDEVVSYEQLVWDTPVSFDRARIRELFGLHWLTAPENVIFCGPVGVGKSFFAQALGHSACRAGHRVRFIKVAKLLQALRQARADHSVERELRTWLAPDLLILDDFGRANSALDRFAHRAYQIVMEGPSLRAAHSPGAAPRTWNPGSARKRLDRSVQDAVNRERPWALRVVERF